MALAALSGDEQGILFVKLCNVLDPGIAVALSSVSNELRTATQPLLPQLRADHEAATALCLKVGLRSCKALREAKHVGWSNKGLTASDLGLLGTLGSVLPALEGLTLFETSGAAGPDGVQRLAERLLARPGTASRALAAPWPACPANSGRPRRGLCWTSGHASPRAALCSSAAPP